MEIQKKFKAGETIIAQGEQGDCAYIIENGKVEITIEQADGSILNVGTRGSGAMIGEMSIIDNAPRTATIIALEDCSLLEITKEDFAKRLEKADPVIRMASKVIITRYRDMVTRANIQNEKSLWPPAELVELGYSEESEAINTIRLASEFKEALKNGEICLHYQPIIDLKTNEVSGFELSVAMAMGDATVGLNVSSQTVTPTTDAAGATANNASSTAGTELWYSVPIGAVTLDVGYGSAAVTTGGNTAAATDDTTTTTTQIGAELSMSF